MSVQKVFAVLITVVACLVIGAFVLNVLLPNSIRQAVNGIEGAIFNGTGFNVNLNGDDTDGKNAGNDAASRGQVDYTDSGNGDMGMEGNQIGGYEGFDGK